MVCDKHKEALVQRRDELFDLGDGGLVAEAQVKTLVEYSGGVGTCETSGRVG